MYAGQTASYNGYQYALFPLDYVYCTQESSPSSYSHCCGHPADWIGPYDNYPYYAPFDCHRIQYLPNYAQVTYCSDNPVWTPSGLHYVTFTVVHDANIPSQTSFRQGELLGHTGRAGQAMGDHVHLDQSLYPDDYVVSYGIYCPGYGNLCAAQEHSTYPDLVWYLGGTETIVQTLSNDFEVYPDHPGPPAGNLTTVMLLCLYKKMKGGKKHGKRIFGL